MKANTMNLRKISLAACSLLMIFVACTKTEDMEQVRLFRPVVKEALASDGNWVKSSWQPISGAVNYTVQLSRDTFRTIVRTISTDTTVYTFENLEWDKFYQVQVKAIASDTIYNSKYSNLGSIKTAKFPTILNTPTTAEVTEEAVKVSWVTGGAAVTSIKILKTSDSSVVATVNLLPADVTNQYKIIAGLAASTGHTIFLYSGTSVRGWADFTTKAPMVGNLIDLRGITGRPSVLADTIPIIASGSTVILKRGETYNIASTINLNKSITIISGSDLMAPGQAVISMPSNFNVTAGAVIDSLVFTDVTLRGTDATAKYIFNINTACTIGKIRYENCLMEIFRGINRFQSAAGILGSFEIKNCIVDSVKDYGVINMDVASSKVDNIKITNSTFYMVDKIVVSSKPTAGSVSVVIENCTINEAPLGNGSTYYVDYGSFGVTNGITINNCIFGIGRVSSGARNVRGVRAGGGTSINASNNFRTSDQVSAGNDIPGITTYTKASIEIFQNPFSGNFKIIDNTFPGRTNTGDPRWRP